MVILKSWEVVAFLKPSGVVIGAPEEQKRRFAASNSNGLRFLIPILGLNRDEDQGKHSQSK